MLNRCAGVQRVNGANFLQGSFLGYRKTYTVSVSTLHVSKSEMLKMFHRFKEKKKEGIKRNTWMELRCASLAAQ